MMRTFRSRNRRGQALVEMAILFPFFLLIVVGGLIDFGFAFYNLLTLQQITDNVCMRVAENTRYPTVSGSASGQINIDADIRSSAIAQANALKPSWWTGNFIPTIPSKTDPVPGFPNDQYLRITITYESQTYTPFYQTLFSSMTGNPAIRLGAAAAYKIPRNLVNR